jgi:deoxyribose-phosphate aldolase
MWTREQVASAIDHTALDPGQTEGDVVAACRDARDMKVAALMVRPTDLPIAVRELEGSDVSPGTPVGFPHGSSRPEVKALEARLAMEDGARELDMVMNIGRFLSGDYALVAREIEAVAVEAHRHGGLVKVIFEICYLTPAQITRACEIARDAGADFVKTSTGFAQGPATPEAVKIMLETVGDSMGVKAAAGIRNWDTAVRYLDLGCRRLGVRATRQVLDGAPV